MSHIENTGGWMPLTLPQLDFWEEFSFHPDEPLSTVAHCIELKGKVDEDALIRAVSRTATEAEVLSVRFREAPDGKHPTQIFDPDCRPILETVDLRSHADPMTEARRLMDADIEAPLDLRADRLSAQLLLRLAEDRYLWYIRAHHIIIDGYGLALIEQRCGQLYRHFRDGADAGHPFHSFASFLAEEEAYRTSRRFAADRSFWTAYLDGSTDLPILHKGVEDYCGGGLHGAAKLPADLPASLLDVSKALGIGWPDLLVLLSGLYLYHNLPRQKAPDGEVLTLWLPFMSRWGSVGAHMPGMLVNILPFFLTVKPGETIGAFLVRSAGVLRKQRLHGRYRIEQIAADRDMPQASRFFFSPLINVLPFSSPEFSDLQVFRHILANGPGDGFNLTFRGEDDGGGLTLQIDADSAMTDPRDFERQRVELPFFLAWALSPAGRIASAAEPTKDHLAGVTG